MVCFQFITLNNPVFVKLSSGLIGQEVHWVSSLSYSSSLSFSLNHQHHMSIKQTEFKFAPINDNTWSRACARIRRVLQKTDFTSNKIRLKRNCKGTCISRQLFLCIFQTRTNLKSSATTYEKIKNTVDSEETFPLFTDLKYFQISVFSPA